MTIKEAAEFLRVSPITVRRYIAAKRLPALRVGRGVRLRREDVERLPKPADHDPARADAVIEAKLFTQDDALWKIVGIEATDESPNEDSTPRISDTAPVYDARRKQQERETTRPPASVLDDLPDEAFLKKGRPTGADDRLWNSIGMFESDGPTDVSENKHKYLAEAYADLHERDEDAQREHYISKGRPFTRKDSLWNLLGIDDSEGPSDIAANMHKYLADAYSDLHERQ